MSKQLTIRIENANPDDPNIPLGDFIQQLEAVLKTLKKTESAAAKEDPGAEWEIVSIRQQSPAVIVLERVTKNRAAQDDQSDYLISRFTNHLSLLQSHAEVPPELDRDTLTAFGELASRVAADRLRVSIANGGAPVEVSPTLQANVKAVLAPRTKSVGSVEGRLEYMDIHGKTNVFRIYPIIGPERVTCHFPSDQLAAARDGIGRSVRVHGLITYLARDPFPSSIRVERLEVLPDDDELPSLLDLHGAAPDATGDRSTGDFLDEIRRVWG